MKHKTNGYLLHEGLTTSGDRFAVIATGFKSKSDNRKTGDMLQLWIILADINPVEGVKSGLDATTVCQGCPFASGRGCYVNAGQAPLGIYKAYKRGGYPLLDASDYAGAFAGRRVRFGAYGNPSLIPLAMVAAIAQSCDGWTGYFHDWKTMDSDTLTGYARFFMASTETESSRAMAERLKIRYFHVSPVQPASAIECVNVTRGTSCSDCRLCAGTSKRAKSIWINPHGSGAAKASKAALAN